MPKVIVNRLRDKTAGCVYQISILWSTKSVEISQHLASGCWLDCIRKKEGLILWKVTYCWFYLVDVMYKIWKYNNVIIV